MNNSAIYLFLGFILFHIGSSVNAQNYFQQKVDFDIKAKLDTLTRTLSAQCKISYTNNSSKALNEIYLHLWWNSHSDKQSAYADQKLERSSYDFHFGNDAFMGAYKDISINQNQNKLEFSYYNNNGKINRDIAIVKLDQPCLPGATIDIDIEYTLAIPYMYSRFGLHQGLYSFTQWYPKPAVFDKSGWHQMPYLDIGEFYYDFGDFNVILDVPGDMEIAATGTRIKLKSENGRKIEEFRAENVTDFAFFISPDLIRVSKVFETDDRTIELNVFRRELNQDWDNAMKYLERTIRFFEDNVGPYPYPQVSIVEGSDSSSSGMEYPMITIIDHNSEEQVLDHLIAHEIGHNWFYGILASNEREYAWLDEGINTYFEEAYIRQHYSEPVYESEIPKAFRSRKSELDLLSMIVLELQNSNRDLAVNTPSSQMDIFNYGVQSYQKMGWALEYLRSYLGEDVFNACVKSYYSEWAFRHPDPKAIQEVFEDVSSQKLDWFFDELLNTTKRFDYRIDRVEATGQEIRIGVSQKGRLNIPYHISVFDASDSLIFNKWFDGLEKDESIVTAIYPDLQKADRITINGHVPFLDTNRKNNHYFLRNGVCKRHKLRFNFPVRTSDSRYYSVNWAPSLMMNGYDGLMTGIQFTNDVFPSGSFKYYANLGFGWNTHKPAGFFSVKKSFNSNSRKFRKWELGLDGKRFHYFDYPGAYLKYQKLVPGVSIHFSRSIRQNYSIEYKAHLLEVDFDDFDESGVLTINKKSNLVHQLNFKSDWHHRLSQNSLMLRLEYDNYESIIEKEHYLKFAADFQSDIAIGENSRFDFRMFGTYFILNSQRESSNYSDEFTHGSFALSGLGTNDYLYESYYFARSDRTGFFSRQIDVRDGGFKTSSGNISKTGKSNDWAIAVNLKSDVPIGIFKKLHLRPFLDMAIVSTKSVNNDPLQTAFYYSGGIAIEFGDFLGFYMPFFNSSEIDQFYNGSSLLNRISFRLNLNKLNLWNYMDNPSILLN